MLVYLCIQTKDPRAAWFIQTAVPSNKQEAHGPHHSPEKQFQSINTFMQSYDYTHYSFLISWFTDFIFTN